MSQGPIISGIMAERIAGVVLARGVDSKKSAYLDLARRTLQIEAICQ